MQLRRVEVRNIRSYRHARLDLGRGTTLLVGDVGSGKTSLLYAVEMALFGTAEIEATFLVRHGATEATVSITLEDDGHVYEVERAFRRVRRKGRETFEPGRLSFRKDGSATSYSATELRQQVIELLGFRDNPNPRAHSDLWRWAVYVPQEQMREILAAPPLERLETVRKALGVERYHLAAENAKEVARDLRQGASALRAQAATLREYAEEFERAAGELRRLGEERARTDASLREVEQTLEALRNRTSEAEHRLHELDSLRDRLADLAGAAAQDQHRQEEAERRGVARCQEAARTAAAISEVTSPADEQATRAQALEAAERRLAERRAEVEQGLVAEANWAGAKKLRETKEAELSRYQQDLERLRAETARKTLAVSETDAAGGGQEPAPGTALSLSELDARLNEARRGEAAATESVALARHGLSEIQELIAGGVCPRCHQPVHSGDFAPHEGEARTALTQALQRSEAAVAERERLETLRRDREAYERAFAAWDARMRRRQDLLGGIEQARETLRQAEARLQRASDDLAVAAHTVEAWAGPARGLGPAREQLTVAEHQVEVAREGVEQVRRAAERRASLEERVGSLRAEEERAEREEAEAAHHREERERQVVELKERLSTEGPVREEARVARSELTGRETERHRLAEVRGRLSGLWEAARERQQRAEAARVARDRFLHDAETVDSQAAWLSSSFHEAVLTMEKRVLERAQAEFAHTFRAVLRRPDGRPRPRGGDRLDVFSRRRDPRGGDPGRGAQRRGTHEPRARLPARAVEGRSVAGGA